MDRSQNGTCNAELSSVMPESRESIQSKITEPACAEFSAMQTGISAKKITCPSSRRQTFILVFHKEKSADTELGFYCIRRLIFLVKYYYTAIFHSSLLCGF